MIKKYLSIIIFVSLLSSCKESPKEVDLPKEDKSETREFIDYSELFYLAESKLNGTVVLSDVFDKLGIPHEVNTKVKGEIGFIYYYENNGVPERGIVVFKDDKVNSIGFNLHPK